MIYTAIEFKNVLSKKTWFCLQNWPSKSHFCSNKENLNFGYICIFSSKTCILTSKYSDFAHFRTRGTLFATVHKFIMFLSCDCKCMTWNNKENIGKTENYCNITAHFCNSLEILFAHENMLNALIFTFNFWGIKVTLSWRKMPLLFEDVVSGP